MVGDFLGGNDSDNIECAIFIHAARSVYEISGLSKIRTAYENAANYQPGLEPTFRSN